MTSPVLCAESVGVTDSCGLGQTPSYFWSPLSCSSDKKSFKGSSWPQADPGNP